MATVTALALTLVLHPDLLTRYQEPELAGHWRGDYGDHYIRVDDDVVRMLYPSRDGRIIGAREGDRIRGQWAEGGNEPSGWVEFRVDRRNRRLRMTGAWGDGPQPVAPSPQGRSWRLERVSETVPAKFARRLANPALFPPLPEPDPNISN